MSHLENFFLASRLVPGSNAQVPAMIPALASILASLFPLPPSIQQPVGYLKHSPFHLLSDACSGLLGCRTAD